MMMLFPRYLFYASVVVIFPWSLISPCLAQESTQSNNLDSQVSGDDNNVIQIPNQNNAQNNNSNEIDISHIAPLVAPPNTENDLGFNFSVGVNSDETTVYMGVIFQPGRTDAHQARMKYLHQQVELLEIQTKVAEARLELLQRQLGKQEIEVESE